MKAKSFGEERIITVLRETEAGAKTKELCGLLPIPMTPPLA